LADFAISLTAFIFAIAILVAVHEWGHYIVARAVGIKVLRYSIGFGRVLWRHTGGPDRTEYCLSAIPIGGYVKLLDERDCEVPASERHRSFNYQPVPARIAVLVAGPAMNFLFAILAYWCMFVVGVPGTKPVLGEISPDSIADQAGLEAGDLVVAVGDRPVTTWEATVLAVLDEMLAEGNVDLTVSRDGSETVRARLETSGREAALTEPGQLFEGIGMKPWSPVLPPVIDELLPGASAEQAGLRSGDRIVDADGEAIKSWTQWVEMVRARPGQTMEISIERDGEIIRMPLTVGIEETDDQPVGRIGASVLVPETLYEGMRAQQAYPVPAAFVEAVAKTWEMSALTVRMVYRMVAGDVSIKNISGPINIAQYAGYSARIGLTPFLGFLAIVSISLAILNLLPIPMLDGGQIAYQLAEAVKGSPLSERAQLIGQQVGILFLLLLMSFAFYNDLSRILG